MLLAPQKTEPWSDTATVERPAYTYVSFRHRQRTVLSRIHGKLMQHEPERRRNPRWKNYIGARDAEAFGALTFVRFELASHERLEIGAVPLGLHQQIVRAGERGEAPAEGVDDIVHARRLARGLSCNRLHHGEDVLDPVIDLPDQEVLSLLPTLAVAAVARDLQHEAMPVNFFQLQAAFDRHETAVLRFLQQFAGPALAAQESGAHRFKIRTGHGRLEQLLNALAHRFAAGEAKEPLAAPVPFEDAVIEIPDEDRVSRQIDKPLLLAQAALALAQRLLDVQALGDVEESDDHAVDLVVDRPVGPDAHIDPTAIAAADFVPDRGQVGQDRARILHQTVVFELVRKVRDGPAFVVQRDAEQFGDTLREAFDAQMGIEEQRTDVGRRHQILQIAVRARNRLQLQLQFAIDGLQLLVDRLQLLLAGLELLRGGAVFFVDRLQLFVRCTQLLIRGVGFLADGAQPRLRQFQFLSEPAHRVAGGGLLIADDEVALDLLALEEHHDCPASFLLLLDRFHLQKHAVRGAVEAHQDRQTKRRGALLEQPMQGRAQFESQFRSHEIDEVSAERPAGRQKVAACVIGEMNDAVRLVDQDAGRRDPLDSPAVRRGVAERRR